MTHAYTDVPGITVKFPDGSVCKLRSRPYQGEWTPLQTDAKPHRWYILTRIRGEVPEMLRGEFVSLDLLEDIASACGGHVEKKGEARKTEELRNDEIDGSHFNGAPELGAKDLAQACQRFEFNLSEIHELPEDGALVCQCPNLTDQCLTIESLIRNTYWVLEQQQVLLLHARRNLRKLAASASDDSPGLLMRQVLRAHMCIAYIEAEMKRPMRRIDFREVQPGAAMTKSEDQKYDELTERIHVLRNFEFARREIAANEDVHCPNLEKQIAETEDLMRSVARLLEERRELLLDAKKNLCELAVCAVDNWPQKLATNVVLARRCAERIENAREMRYETEYSDSEAIR